MADPGDTQADDTREVEVPEYKPVYIWNLTCFNYEPFIRLWKWMPPMFIALYPTVAYILFIAAFIPYMPLLAVFLPLTVLCFVSSPGCIVAAYLRRKRRVDAGLPVVSTEEFRALGPFNCINLAPFIQMLQRIPPVLVCFYPIVAFVMICVAEIPMLPFFAVIVFLFVGGVVLCPCIGIAATIIKSRRAKAEQPTADEAAPLADGTEP